MEVTLDIDEALLAELKLEATRQGRTPSEIAESALRKFVFTPEEQSLRKSNRRFTLDELIAGMTAEKQHPSLIDDDSRGSEFPNEEP
jgi:hypothetical protein